MTRSVSPPAPAPAPWPRLMLISCAAAGSAPRMIATTAAPVARRTQRPIADDVKLCCSDGPTNSPSPVRGCHRGSVAVAAPCLRAALRSVSLQGDSARPLPPQPALAWVRRGPRLWRLDGAAPPPADAPSRQGSDRRMQGPRRRPAEARARTLGSARASLRASAHGSARARLHGAARARPRVLVLASPRGRLRGEPHARPRDALRAPLLLVLPSACRGEPRGRIRVPASRARAVRVAAVRAVVVPVAVVHAVAPRARTRV